MIELTLGVESVSSGERLEVCCGLQAIVMNAFSSRVVKKALCSTFPSVNMAKFLVWGSLIS